MIGGAVLDVGNRERDLAEGIADGVEEALVVVPVGRGVAAAVVRAGDAPKRIVFAAETGGVGIQGVGEPAGSVVVKIGVIASRVLNGIERATRAINVVGGAAQGVRLARF